MTPDVGSTSFDVVVIGASQAGLAIGYHLAQRGVRFVILDGGSDIGHVWRSRWDSLKLFTPAQYSSLPGMAFPAPKDTYPSKDDVASYLESYASDFDLPVKLNATVTSLTSSEGGYFVATADQEFRADHVVVATGPFQVPFVPPVAGDLDDTVFQVHGADYRNPAQLPDGEVLVVGGGNSGFQIAEELAATRKVSLAIGQRVPSLPQRLLGKDLFWWLSGVGFLKVSTDSRLGRKLAKRDVLIGSSTRRLRRSGVTLRGRLTSATGRRVGFEDGTEQDFDAIIWATGYRSDFSWIEVSSIKAADGTIVHRRGVTDASGLFFLGLPWQHTRGSALIGFVEDDAAFIAGRIDSHLGDPAGLVGTERTWGGTYGDGSGSGVRHAHRQ
jgi:putative flavoprotein involved in K+ transport